MKKQEKSNEPFSTKPVKYPFRAILGPFGLIRMRIFPKYGSIESPYNASPFTKELEKNNEYFLRYFLKGPFWDYFAPFCPNLTFFLK